MYAVGILGSKTFRRHTGWAECTPSRGLVCKQRDRSDSRAHPVALSTWRPFGRCISSSTPLTGPKCRHTGHTGVWRRLGSRLCCCLDMQRIDPFFFYWTTLAFILSTGQHSRDTSKRRSWARRRRGFVSGPTRRSCCDIVCIFSCTGPRCVFGPLLASLRLH